MEKQGKRKKRKWGKETRGDRSVCTTERGDRTEPRQRQQHNEIDRGLRVCEDVQWIEASTGEIEAFRPWRGSQQSFSCACGFFSRITKGLSRVTVCDSLLAVRGLSV